MSRDKAEILFLNSECSSCVAMRGKERNKKEIKPFSLRLLCLYAISADLLTVNHTIHEMKVRRLLRSQQS